MDPRKWINLEAQAPQDIVRTDESAFAFLQLSWTTRLYCFGGCLLGGIGCQILGAILLFLGSLAGFGVLFVIGIILALAGSGFLVGFASQLKGMFAPIRIVATALFLISVVVVCLMAFWLQNEALTLIFVIVEGLAYAWYSISYIPYARDLIKRTFSACF